MTRHAQAREGRGFYGIGIQHGKCAMNLGTLWRSAYIFDAAFIFTIGKRFQREPSDTVKTWRHVPVYHYASFEAFYEHMPYDAQLIGVELDERAVALDAFAHPQRAVYLLGAEDHGLSAEARKRCHRLVQLPGRFCLNVAVAGSLVMHSRHQQLKRLAA